MWSTGNRRTAFTLVELIVVVVLVTVLAGMIAPRLWGAGGAASLQSAARRLTIAGQYARDFAATHRCRCRLVLDTKTGRFQLIYQVDPEHKPEEYKPVRGELGRAESLEEPLRFGWIRVEPSRPGENNETKDNQITFYPSGQSDAAIVQITDGRRTYSVVVLPSRGRCRLIEGAVEQLPGDQWDLDA